MVNALLVFLMLLSFVTGLLPWDNHMAILVEERANQLAAGGPFEHTPYIRTRLNNSGCTYYGEMLGRTRGGNIFDLFFAFMESPKHRALMERDWDRMALALTHNDAWDLIIVVSFLGGCDKTTW